MENPTAVAITGVVTMSGVGLLVGQAPKLRDVRRAHKSHDPETIADLRTAEVMAASTMCLAGIALSAMTGSPAPAYLAIATSVVAISCYEWALASPGAADDGGLARWEVPRTESHPFLRSAATGDAPGASNR